MKQPQIQKFIQRIVLTCAALALLAPSHAQTVVVELEHRFRLFKSAADEARYAKALQRIEAAVREKKTLHEYALAKNSKVIFVGPYEDLVLPGKSKTQIETENFYPKIYWQEREQQYDSEMLIQSNRYYKIKVNSERTNEQCILENIQFVCNEGKIFSLIPNKTYAIKVGDSIKIADSLRFFEAPLKQFIIVGFGDSIAAGEGAPDIQMYTRKLTSALPVQNLAPARWIDHRCHRSLFSGQAQATYQMMLKDPEKNKEYIFIPYGCSGANILSHANYLDNTKIFNGDGGVLEKYYGIESQAQIKNYFDSFTGNITSPCYMEYKTTNYLHPICINPISYSNYKDYSIDKLLIESQIQSAKKYLKGNSIDLILLQIGANDINFGGAAVKGLTESCKTPDQCKANLENATDTRLYDASTHQLNNTLPKKLGYLYQAIEANLSVAKIIHGEYLNPTVYYNQNTKKIVSCFENERGSIGNGLIYRNIGISSLEYEISNEIIVQPLNKIISDNIKQKNQLNKYLLASTKNDKYNQYGLCVTNNFNTVSESETKQGKLGMNIIYRYASEAYAITTYNREKKYSPLNVEYKREPSNSSSGGLHPNYTGYYWYAQSILVALKQ